MKASEILWQNIFNCTKLQIVIVRFTLNSYLHVDCIPEMDSEAVTKNIFILLLLLVLQIEMYFLSENIRTDSNSISQIVF